MNLDSNGKPFVWTCIVCDKPITISHEGRDDDGTLPNLEGGTIDIHCGYGSKYDFLDLQSAVYAEYINLQSAVCDACIKKKSDFIRQVEIRRNNRMIPVESQIRTLNNDN